MKQYLRDLTFISILIIVGVLILSEKSFNDDFLIFKTINTHYKKVAWNINLINKKPSLLDGSTIFLGSSIVQGGINDSLINSKGIKAINMGVPHNGYELGLYFQNRILNVAKPNKIFFLQGKISYGGLHKLTPLLYTSSELLNNGQTINLDYIRFIFKKSKLTLEYLFFRLKQKSEYTNENEAFLRSAFGQINTSNVISTEEYEKYTAQIQGLSVDESFNLYLNDYLYQNEKQESKFKQKLKRYKRIATDLILNNNFIFNRKNQQKFFDKAVCIPNIKNTTVEVIYIPILIDASNTGDYSRKDFKKGPSCNVDIIHLKNHKFLKKRKFWSDKDHLNNKGANEFTYKIIPLLE